jgi:hypothetical protein
MKKIATLILTALTMSGSLLQAGFSEQKLEKAIASATKSSKPIAFVFYQDYALPNCPRCIASTNANNKAIKKALPRPDAVVIEIEKGDKDLDKLPSSVSANGATPRIVITDSTGEKVITQLEGAPDSKKAKEFKALVKKARTGA